MKFEKEQRVISGVFASIVVLLFLFPPWKASYKSLKNYSHGWKSVSVGRSFVLRSPSPTQMDWRKGKCRGSPRINGSRLWDEILLISLAGCLLTFVSSASGGIFHRLSSIITPYDPVEARALVRNSIKIAKVAALSAIIIYYVSIALAALLKHFRT